MKENIEILLIIMTVVFGILGLVGKRKKDRESGEEAQSSGSGSDRGSGSSADSWREAKPGRGRNFADVLRELAEAVEEPSPTVAPRPVAGQLHRTMPQPAATSHDYYSLETDYDGMDGRSYRDDHNAEQAREVSVAKQTARVGVRTQPSEAMAAQKPDTRSHFAEIAGEEFDLRRAVIEAEILNLKY